ncbi:spore photoproduct lyase [Desulfurispora thermophila]|uniref:spore photoproduct lyase n=1 Tax=Desulfurispora thermophila TaxID=265470 RepID=UPI0003785762|nr:spore photoproduct lyase [Desulfurispora thermophila]
MPFVPAKVYFERDALDYPLGRELHHKFQAMQLPVTVLPDKGRVPVARDATPRQAYFEAKRTLVVGVRRTLKLATCKPSAHYQLPLTSSCSGKCEYCYLQTTLGNRPYVRVYVNIDEILETAARHIQERAPRRTVFEGAATSDPVPVEPYTGVLRRTIEFFAGQSLGRFRFVTKFTDVDGLLDAPHNGHTRIRFSVNTPHIIRTYEHGTPALSERLAAARRVARAGYPLGFIIAPVFIYDGWEDDYRQLLRDLAAEIAPVKSDDITFEIISHRFTRRAKQRILEVFPDTGLPMLEEVRRFKFGQFGYGKYIYQPAQMAQIESLFFAELPRFFPRARPEYLI